MKKKTLNRGIRGLGLLATGTVLLSSVQNIYAGEANQGGISVVINEVESNDPDKNPDWVEIYNAGNSPVDISGWYILDNEPDKHLKDTKPLADNTILNPGECYVLEEETNFGFGLGKEDQVTLYDKDGNKIDEYAWSAHANGTYARIPDGIGEFVDSEPSKGTANSKNSSGSNPSGSESDDGNTQNKPAGETVEWQGDESVSVSDMKFLKDSSGLDFANGKLYAIDNGTGKFWVMDVAKDGKMSFSEGFENGKRIRFKKDVQDSSAKGPDTEGITVDGDGFVYAASERDNGNKKVNYDTILKVNPNEQGDDLVALKEWNLTDYLPGVDANYGIEAVEWVPASEVNGKLYDSNKNAAFDIANYPNATANGVFFTALEKNGHVYAFVLNEDETVEMIADIDSTIGGVMALDYDTYEHVLWAASDNDYGNVVAKIKFTGEASSQITLVNPPKGLDATKNYEGFAIADASYTVNGQRPVYRFEDGVEEGALVIGSIACDYKVEGEQTQEGENQQNADVDSNVDNKGEDKNQQQNDATAQSKVESSGQTVSTTSPKTADSARPGFFASVLAGATALLAAFAFKRKNDKSDEIKM